LDRFDPVTNNVADVLPDVGVGQSVGQPAARPDVAGGDEQVKVTLI
jgi:hypothetical protein